VPTMIFRNETERNDELGENIVLTKFDKDIIMEFLTKYPNLRAEKFLPNVSPTQIIIESLQNISLGKTCRS
ncbi:MAG: hypothetical protein ACTSPQ_20535, partial [Candidatus Helarchaeota archaeon]